MKHSEEIISPTGTPVPKVAPLDRTVNRTGRGSLRGSLVIMDNWDSDEINNTIAADFGTDSCSRCSTAMRSTLTAAVADETARTGLFDALIDRFGRLGGVELDQPTRATPPRAAPLPE